MVTWEILMMIRTPIAAVARDCLVVGSRVEDTTVRPHLPNIFVPPG